MEISSLGKQTCSPYTILTPLRPLHPEPCSTKLSTSQLLTRVMAALRCYTAHSYPRPILGSAIWLVPSSPLVPASCPSPAYPCQATVAWPSRTA